MDRQTSSTYCRIAFALVVFAVSSCKSFRDSYNEGFKESFLPEFTRSCTQGAVEKGASELRAKPICECIGQHLIDHHSGTELTRLFVGRASPESNKAVEEATAACQSNVRAIAPGH